MVSIDQTDQPDFTNGINVDERGHALSSCEG